MELTSMTVKVRCRTNSHVDLFVSVDQDHNVWLTSRRYKGNGEAVDYEYPAMPSPKRWWGEYIAEVHPADREALHKFLGLS